MQILGICFMIAFILYVIVISYFLVNDLMKLNKENKKEISFSNEAKLGMRIKQLQHELDESKAESYSLLFHGSLEKQRATMLEDKVVKLEKILKLYEKSEITKTNPKGNYTKQTNTNKTKTK